MSSLEGCIKKAGKSIRVEDAEAIRKIRDDIYGAGDVTRDVANQQAVDEYVQILEEETQEILKQAEERGGLLADRSLSPSEFAKQTAKRLEDRAAEMPRIGLQRNRASNQKLDLLSMSMPELHKVLEYFDTDLATEVLEAHGGMAGLKKLKGADLDSAVDIYLEHIVPFTEGSRKVPLRYSITPRDQTLKALTEAAPDHPGIVLEPRGRSLDVAETRAAVKPKDVRGIIESFTKSGASESAKKVMLSLIPQRYLSDFVTNGMLSVKYYVERLGQMNTYVEEIMSDHAAITETWTTFNKIKGATDLLGQLMHTTTLAGVDMQAWDQQNPDEAAYKRMSKKARKKWDNRRAAHEALLPFWEKLGKMGTKVNYEKFVFRAGGVDKEGNRVEGKMVKVSSEMLPEGHALYAQVRDAYAAMRARQIEGIEIRIEQTAMDGELKRSRLANLRQVFEKGKIGPYFPLERFGRYAVVAKDPDTMEVVAFFKRENKSERNRLVEELTAQGYYAYRVDEANDDLAMAHRIDPNFVEDVITMINEAMPGMDGNPSAEGLRMQNDIWQMYLRSLPEMSVRKNMITRTGRLGFDRDALRAFGKNMFHGAHQAGKLKYGNELNQYLTDAEANSKELSTRGDIIQLAIDGMMPKKYIGKTLHDYMYGDDVGDYRRKYDAAIAKNPTDLDIGDRITREILEETRLNEAWAVPVYDSLATRHEYNMNPNNASWSTNLTAFGFLWYLSTSPAAAALNLTQTAIVGLPVLGAEFNMTGAASELLKASKQYATSGEVIKGTFGSKLRNDEFTNSEGKTTERDYGEKAAMDALSDQFTKTRSRELSEIAVEGAKHSDTIRNIVEKAGWMFHKSEEGNRMVTALAAYRLARKKFSTDKTLANDQARHDKAVELARKLVLDSHFDYGSTNRPPIMQGDFGKVIFLFRNYSVNMQYRLARDFRDGVWKNDNITKEERIKARTRFAGIMTMTSMFAGVAGWPLMSIVHNLLDFMLGDDDEAYDSRTDFRVFLADALGPKMAEAIYKGPWDAVTGLSLSARTSLDNMWIREIPTSLTNKEKVLHLFSELAGGPLGGMVTNVASGFDEYAGGNTQRAFEKWSPKFLADASKALRYYNDGAQNRDRDLILPPEAFEGVSGARNLIGQLAGFVPAELSLQYDQNRALMDSQSKLKRRHSDLMNRLFMGYKLGDRKAIRLTLRDIAAWNRKNPTKMITPKSIRKSAKSRAAYDMRTVGGVALDKRLQYLHETLRFTAKD